MLDMYGIVEAAMMVVRISGEVCSIVGNFALTFRESCLILHYHAGMQIVWQTVQTGMRVLFVMPA